MHKHIHRNRSSGGLVTSKRRTLDERTSMEASSVRLMLVAAAIW